MYDMILFEFFKLEYISVIAQDNGFHYKFPFM